MRATTLALAAFAALSLAACGDEGPSRSYGDAEVVVDDAQEAVAVAPELPPEPVADPVADAASGIPEEPIPYDQLAAEKAEPKAGEVEPTNENVFY